MRDDWPLGGLIVGMGLGALFVVLMLMHCSG